MKTVTVEYDPSQRQTLFHKDPAKYRLYGGSVRSGKSYALCMEAIKQSVKYPRNMGLIARKRYSDLYSTTMKTFFKVCPREYILKWNEQKGILTFRNYSQIKFNHLEDPENIKSMDLGWWAVDEVTDCYYTDFLMLTSRLSYSLRKRPKEKGGENWKEVRKKDRRGKETIFYIPRYCGFMATNPEPGWVKKMFVDNVEPESGRPLKNPQNYSFIRALPTDNLYNTEEYIEDISSRDKDWVEKYVKGNWTSLKGRIYSTFREETHVKDFKIQDDWLLFRGIDYGTGKDPTVCIYAGIDSDGRIWIFDEYYDKDETKSTSDHVASILAKYPKNKYHFTASVADTHALGKQLARDMRRMGLSLQNLKYSNIQEGINRVKSKLLSTFDTPNLIIHKRCKNTIEEFYEYQYKERKDTELNPLDEPMDRMNHAADCIRYIIMQFADKRPPKEITRKKDFRDLEYRKKNNPSYQEFKVSPLTNY